MSENEYSNISNLSILEMSDKQRQWYYRHLIDHNLINPKISGKEFIKGVSELEALWAVDNSNGDGLILENIKDLAEKHSRKVLEDFIADHFPEDSKLSGTIPKSDSNSVSTTYAGKYEYTIPDSTYGELRVKIGDTPQYGRVYSDLEQQDGDKGSSAKSLDTEESLKYIEDQINEAVKERLYEKAARHREIYDKLKVAVLYPFTKKEVYAKGIKFNYCDGEGETFDMRRSSYVSNKPETPPADLDLNGCNAEGCYAWGEFLKGVEFVDGGYQWKKVKTEVPCETKYKNGDCVYHSEGRYCGYTITKSHGNGFYTAKNYYGDELNFHESDKRVNLDINDLMSSLRSLAEKSL